MIDTLNPNPHQGQMAVSPGQAAGEPNWTAGLVQPAPHDYPEVKKTDDKPEKVDHLAMIADLVADLAETSPSGANTIGAKIMYHVCALADPAAFDKAEAEKAKADKEQARKDAEKLKKIKGDMKAKATA